MGKTLLARCIGSHSYFGGLFNLDQYEEDADYAVFDDLAGGMEYFHSYKQWLGCQKEFTVTDKYRHKGTCISANSLFYAATQIQKTQGGL